MWWAQLLNTITAILDAGAGGGGGAYESIATVTVSGATLTFSSIPSTYKHLQVRALFTSGGASIGGIFNGDSAANYANHTLVGNGSAATAEGAANVSALLGTNFFYGGFPNSTFPASLIFDVIDYASTSKFKTIRAIAGMDNNGASAPYIALGSGLWRSTSAVTSISFAGVTGTFSLYGIKGA
jgi:hypothetical protein